MKTFLFIFIFALSLNAESFINNRCVDSFYFMDYQSSTPYVIYSKTPTVVNTLSSSDTATLVNNIGKFKYDATTQRCKAIMTDSNNQVLISSLTGILIGFTILFFAIFLTIKVGSRK